MIQLNAPQKLTTSTLVYLLLRSLIIAVIIAAVLYFVAESPSSVQNYKQLILLAAVVLPILILIYEVLWWKLFEYTIGTDSVNIQSGVIFRSEKNIDFNKIQSINAVFGPLLALFGLRQVRGFTSSPEQLVVTSTGRGTQTQHIPDIQIILGKDDAEQFLQMVRKGDIQKVQTVN